VSCFFETPVNDERYTIKPITGIAYNCGLFGFEKFYSALFADVLQQFSIAGFEQFDKKT